MLEGKLFWGSPPRRRRATAPRSASAGRLGDGVFLRKIKAGAGAHAMLDGKQFFQKAQPGIARVRAARAAPRCRACACEGSEAWRADTLVFASIEPARTMHRASGPEISLIQRCGGCPSTRTEASDLVAPLRSTAKSQSAPSSARGARPAALSQGVRLIKRAETEPSAQS